MVCIKVFYSHTSLKKIFFDVKACFIAANKKYKKK